MKLGIVGLPNVGKSTLFNALTKANVPSENYPFCTIDPNIGTVTVPDDRLITLQKVYGSKKITHASIDFVDIAGLVKGASKGEGLGNKFLSHIREVDAIIHIVRCFDDSDIIHQEGSINPKRDIETINTELLLADIETVQKKIEKTGKELRINNEPKLMHSMEIFNNLIENLSKGFPARTFSFKEEDNELIKNMLLLTGKPIIYVANISEKEININNNKYLHELTNIADDEKAEILVVSAKIEQEISQLEDKEKEEFINALDLNESGLDKLIKTSYRLLGQISFLTANEQEVRAWTIKKGTKAPQAAGKIHTDFEKGFIKAEVYNFNDLLEFGTLNSVREHGKIRIEGKDYIIQENDVAFFKFNL